MYLHVFVVLVVNFEFARSPRKQSAQPITEGDDRVHGNGLHGEIPTKKEPIRRLRFILILHYHIINVCSATEKT